MVTKYSNANQSAVSGPSDLPSRIVLRIPWIAIALKTARIQMDRHSYRILPVHRFEEGGPENISAPEVRYGGGREICRTTRAKAWIFCPTGQTKEELVSSSSRLGVAEGEELESNILSQDFVPFSKIYQPKNQVPKIVYLPCALLSRCQAIIAEWALNPALLPRSASSISRSIGTTRAGIKLMR